MISSDFCRGLVSDDENDQARDQGRVRRCCTSSPASGSRSRPPDRGRRDQRAARAAQAAGRAGRASTTCCRSRSSSTCRSEVCHERNRARPDRDFGPHVVRQQRAQLRRVAAGACSARASAASACWPRRDRGGRGRARAAVDRPPRRARPVRHHRRHPRLPRRAASRCCASSATRVDGDGPSTPPPTAARAVSSATRRPRPATRRPCCKLVMAMVDAGTAICSPATTTTSSSRKLKGRDVQITHGLAETLEQLEREPRRVPRRRVARLPRRARQPRRARRRQARRRPRRHEGGYRAARRARVRDFALLRRDDRRDRRVRPAGAAAVGGRLPRQGDGRLRPHAGRRAGVGQQHDLHRHRLRLRRPADGAALARARAGLGAGRRDVLRAGPAVPAAPTRRDGRASTAGDPARPRRRRRQAHRHRRGSRAP